MEQDPVPSDGELLAAFAATGMDSAFTSLVERHGAMVHGVCCRVLSDHHEAQDVAQAVFLTLARKAAALARQPDAGGWLHVVAWRLAVKVRQSRLSRQRREVDMLRDTAQSEAPDVERHAARAELDQALGQLPERYRQPLVLFHLEERSVEETARLLALNAATLRTRLSRGRELLRRELLRRGVAAGAAGVLEESATSVALPAAVVAATCQAASLVAAGKTLSGSGLVSAKVAYLTKSALKTLFWAKVKTAAAAVVLTAGVVVGGVVVAHRALAHHAGGTPPPAVTAPAPKTGMVLIPGGTNAGTDPDLQQPYSLTVAPFLMDRCEVTKALWDEVANWSRAKGYAFTGTGAGKAPDHPVHSVSWSDCVTWCNARSEKDGFAPVYSTDAAGTVVYRGSRGGELHVKATADGYRLPTLVEWQYAAHGGQPSHRFPWHDAETVQHARANYRSGADFTWDTSPTRGCHPAYAVDPQPYTSPVGAFAPNAYGLYDLLGNVSEWCFDSVAGFGRPGMWGLRCGGSWMDWAEPIGTAQRKDLPSARLPYAGLRTVRTPRTPAVPGSPPVP